jgi:hypothetical protein
MTMEFGDYLVNLSQSIASAYGSWLTVALSTQRWNWSTNQPTGEGTTDWWKKFDPASVNFSATFDHVPDAPTLAPLSDCYQACTSPAVVRSLTPTLGVGVHDVDNPSGAVLQTWFAVTDTTESTVVAQNSTVVMATSGGTPRWTVPAGALANGVTYHWHARVVDELDGGSAWSAWGVFTVDTTAPGLPAISSPQYPERQWGPGESTAATFTFGPGGASDVVEYWWSIDGLVAPTRVAATGGLATVSWTSRGMVDTLRVYAVDAAGNAGPTRSYQLWVTPAPNRYSQWTLDETSGTTAADTGRNMLVPAPATLGAGAGWGPGRVAGGASLGGPGAITTAGPVLDTTRGFSVAAWVDAASLAGDRVVVAQQGASVDLFQLSHRGSDDRWCFSMRAGDSGTAAVTAACSALAPRTGAWVHLVGVYDAAAGLISIYVDGGPNGDGSIADAQAPVTGTWMATGALVIGESWSGGIDEVVAAQRVLGSIEILQLASGGRLS